MIPRPENPIVVALDISDIDRAETLARSLEGRIGMFRSPGRGGPRPRRLHCPFAAAHPSACARPRSRHAERITPHPASRERWRLRRALG